MILLILELHYTDCCNLSCSMAALLAKFRIDFSDVVVIPDVTKKAGEETRRELDAVLAELPEDVLEPGELQVHKEKTNRHLR